MPLATVFGASSNHARSLVEALAASHWHVRAIVTSPVTSFSGSDVSVFVMPELRENEIRQAVLGADMVYISHAAEFADPDYPRKELQEGKLVGEACKALGTRHVILHTQLSPQRVLALTSRHCDVKADVEEYLTELRLPLTCVELPWLYENLYTAFQPEMVGRGQYRLAIPAGEGSMDCMSYRDVGPAVASLANSVVKGSTEPLHKTYALSGDKISVREMARRLADMTGWKVEDRQMTVYEFKQLGWPGCVDVANYFDFISRVDQRFNIHVTRQLHPAVLTFQQWLDAHKHEVMKHVFNYTINGH